MTKASDVAFGRRGGHEAVDHRSVAENLAIIGRLRDAGMADGTWPDVDVPEPPASVDWWTEPGVNRHPAPTQPGPVGLWLLDGWWQHTVVRWPMRGLQYELGTRVVATMRRRLG